MVIQPPYRNIHRRCEKAIRMRDQIDFLVRVIQNDFIPRGNILNTLE